MTEMGIALTRAADALRLRALTAEARNANLRRVLREIGDEPCRRNWYSGAGPILCPQIGSITRGQWCAPCKARVAVEEDDREHGR